jgi:NADH-quinone oxidoreductase subunit L
MHATHASHLWLIPFLPLLGAVVNGFFGLRLQKRYGRTPVNWVACGTVFVSFLLSVYTFIRLLGVEPRLLEDHLWTWFQVGDLHVDFAFMADPLTAVMILVVTGVGFLIHVYSTGYMAHDAGHYRYFAYLNLFVFAMLTLVMGKNLPMMFIGWEGVGLCSYLLIGFWFTDLQKAAAGMKAFITNRIGDFGFVVGFFALFWGLVHVSVPTVDFVELRQVAAQLAGQRIFGIDLVTFVTFCFFVGATGKSAQIPLYVWLPDAMAGPTPVSALIHAATMVTAGIYMVGRLNFLYSMAPATLAVVAVVGAATAVFAATIGLVQNDIKKVLAYSTVSQLGYMFLGMGVAAYAAGIFHLMTHAFFKACLFLGSGSVIHALHDEQDIRRMGGLRRWMPRTYITFLISTLAIAGLPPLAGFFSKDEILWKAWSSPHGSPALWAAGVLGAGMTAFYMFRLVFLTFFGECRADAEKQEHLHESPSSMTLPLLILAVLAIGGGWIGVPASLGGANYFERFLEPVFAPVGAAGEAAHAAGIAAAGEGAHAGGAALGAGAHAAAVHAAEPLEYVLMAVSVLIALVGIGLAHRFYIREPALPGRLAERFRRTYRTLYNKYWVDELYGATVIAGTRGASRWLAAFDAHVIDGIVNGMGLLTRAAAWIGGAIDRWIVDGAVNTVGRGIQWCGSGARRLQTGVIQNYVLAVFGGVIVLVVLMRFL